jgi:hypothetical protein
MSELTEQNNDNIKNIVSNAIHDKIDEIINDVMNDTEYDEYYKPIHNFITIGDTLDFVLVSLSFILIAIFIIAFNGTVTYELIINIVFIYLAIVAGLILYGLNFNGF